MTHSNVIKTAALGVQTQHQIAQAFSPCELRVAHANEMTPRSKALCPTVRVVAINQVLEMRKGHESKQLRKHGLTFIHATTSFKKVAQFSVCYLFNYMTNYPRLKSSEFLIARKPLSVLGLRCFCLKFIGH
jgi:hypothetical protein